MNSCGLIFMCGSCNGTVKQCKVKEQSIYFPTNNNNNYYYYYYYYYLLQLGCHPVAVVILHVNKYEIIYN